MSVVSKCADTASLQTNFSVEWALRISWGMLIPESPVHKLPRILLNAVGCMTQMGS